MSNPSLKYLDLNTQERFYKRELSEKIIIYMTSFVSGTFGLEINKNN